MTICHPVLILPFLLIPALLISGCTVTGPPDDGWDNSYEWVNNGRLLSDETKTVYSSSDSQNSSASQGTNLNYDAYQQWQDAKESNTAEYQKFKQWQEFEAYERWKKEQNLE